MEALRPLLNMDLGVVAPGEDEGDPAGGQGAVRQPVVVAVTAEVAVEQFGKAQLLGQADEQGDIIEPFVQRAGGCIHPAIMPPEAAESAHHPRKRGLPSWNCLATCTHVPRTDSSLTSLFVSSRAPRSATASRISAGVASGL